MANGLNQLTSYGAKSLTHDSKGNVTAFGTKAFTYSSENLLLTGPSSTLSYDPLMRLRQITGAATTQFGWDGVDMIAEHDGAGALQRRYVMDPGNPTGQPIVWYEGTGTSDRRFLSSDERGSIISVTDGSGALLGINRYDEFGQPQSSNIGRFGYTGQAWLPDLGLWYYRARMYEPELGRFLQTDPIGYADSPNLYQYVLNDPVNLIDPLGLEYCGGSCSPIIVSGGRVDWTESLAKISLEWTPRSGDHAGFGGGCLLRGDCGAQPPPPPTPKPPQPPKPPKPPKPVKPKEEKPAYCRSGAYQFANDIDNLGAWAQGAALEAAAVGQTEPYEGARIAAKRFFAGTAYEAIGWARLGANAFKALYGDYGSGLKDVALNTLGKALGGDVLAKSAGEFGIDVATDAFMSSPCE